MLKSGLAMSETLSKVYESAPVERKLYQEWESQKLFTPSGDPYKRPFTIVIPPPNVTGSLHMGHALNNTIQDILIRWKRMQGFDTLWVPGTDHAGIATQNVVERELKKEGKRKEDLGRDEFLKRVWKWKEEYGGRITGQLRRLGAACDWTRERFTMDEGLTKAVRRHFVQLYHEGLIYRGKRIINWCPRCKTALSDIETVYETIKGHLWYIRYPSVTGNQQLATREHIVVATTRPETMLGDTAVAVNPEDTRYKNWIGKKLILPLVNREIPVIADSFVDPTFGTGAVKVTPAHDPNDYEMGLRHNLTMPIILDETGHVRLADFTDSEREETEIYRGHERFRAREEMVEDLKKKGLLEKVENYETSIGHCYRCKTVVEPYLSDQWFVKMQPLAQKAIAAVQEGRIRFIPERWTKVYLHWMEQIRDWCISRQIWWGHRIPVWTCECGERIVPPLEKFMEDPNVCPHCNGTHLQQDFDVLDTWFSSALWPFSTLGWPGTSDDLRRYYPTDVLVTGYDIISFWVARMIVASTHFLGREPFHTVYVHGLVRDVTGKKMSKSLGNVINPVEVIDHVGSDALRFALASLISGQGQDVKLSEQKIIEARHFANKIWNAARFVMMTSSNTISPHNEPQVKSLADQWILSRYHQTIADVTSLLESYDFGGAARSLYTFTWSEFCDWYVEISKFEKNISLLQYILMGTLHLLHPFMPFITEEIHRAWNPNTFLLQRNWPQAEPGRISNSAEEKMEFVMEVIGAIRSIRATFRIPQDAHMEMIVFAPDAERAILEETQSYLLPLAKLKSVRFQKDDDPKPHHCALSVVGTALLYLPLEQYIDIPKEVARLEREIQEISEHITRIDQRLIDENFLRKADPINVQEDRERAAHLHEQQETIQYQIGLLKV